MDYALRVLSALLMVALPLAVGVYFSRRWKMRWGLAAIGGATFLLSQAVHIPFNSAFLNPILARLGFGTGASAGWPLALAAVLLGLSAGVFEEGARFLVYRFWIRNARTYRQGVTFGLGHGGAEAIAIGILAILQHAQAFALQGQDLAAIVPANQLEAARAQLEAYWSTPAPAFFLSTFERAFALVVQITLSVLVLQAFIRPRGALWLLAAVGWHALVDAGAVYTGVLWGAYQGLTSGAIASEILVGVFAATSLLILLRLRPTSEPEGPRPAADLPPVMTPLPPDEPAPPERIDETRYTPAG
jgi:uncharacterized membrane protein YhfC